MSWLELSINTTAEAVDWVCTSLTKTVSVNDIRITEYSASSTDRGITPAWAFQIRLYLPYNGRDSATKEIVTVLSSLHRVGLASDPEMAVVDAKPEHTSRFRSHRIGQRFVLITSDAPDRPLSSSDILLKFDTSLAFGSGFHPATGLCLQLLERHVLPSMQALDLGTGTGILSVAMAKLGAEVLALDNDSIAIQAAQRAIQLNGVTSQVTVQQGSLGEGSDLGHWMGNDLSGTVSKLQPTAAFDLIVANILARVHVALVKDYQLALRRTTASAGLLITGGFTTDQEQDVHAALTDAGFAAIDCQRSNEWVALVHQLVE